MHHPRLLFLIHFFLGLCFLKYFLLVLNNHYYQMKKLFFITMFIFVISCGGVDFVYKEDKNLINPLYEKTEVSASGFNMNFMNSYLPMFFGKNKDLQFKTF